MLIREMNLADLDQVMKIETQAFSDHWPRSAYEYELNENPYSTLYVGVKDDSIVGVCGLYHLFEEAQIITLATHVNWRKQGIAQALLNKMIEEADLQGCCTFSLEVRISNDAAISLYEKNGFIKINIRKEYYKDGEDAYLMMKALGGNYEQNISD